MEEAGFKHDKFIVNILRQQADVSDMKALQANSIIENYKHIKVDTSIQKQTTIISPKQEGSPQVV